MRFFFFFPLKNKKNEFRYFSSDFKLVKSSCNEEIILTKDNSLSFEGGRISFCHPKGITQVRIEIPRPLRPVYPGTCLPTQWKEGAKSRMFVKRILKTRSYGNGIERKKWKTCNVFPRQLIKIPNVFSVCCSPTKTLLFKSWDLETCSVVNSQLVFMPNFAQISTVFQI